MSEKINIDPISDLSRLNLKPDERKKISKDLEAILAYVDQLKELNTENIPPTSHALALENVFRKDVVRPSQVRDAVLKYAPDRQENFFKVPKVIEGGS